MTLAATAGTILVVEDDPAMRELLAESLTALGYRTLTADSAEMALGLLESVAPDLILTDVHMRAMSGIELTVRVKRAPRFELTAGVILTAVVDLDARRRARGGSRRLLRQALRAH